MCTSLGSGVQREREIEREREREMAHPALKSYLAHAHRGLA